MPKYHSKPEEKPEEKIIFYESVFRELGKAIDDVVNAIIKAILGLTEEQRKKLLEELSKK